MPLTVNGFIGQKAILRQAILAANVQTEWGEPVASGAYAEALRFDASAFAKFGRKKESTYGQAGALNSFANENWTVAESIDLDLSGFLTDWIAGYLFAIAMGKEVVTGAGTYSHTINFLDQGLIAQCSSIYAQDTNDLFYQLVDMGISQLTITASSTGAMKYKATLMGTGVYVQGSLPSMPTPVKRQQLYGSDLQVSIGPAAGGTVSFYPRVQTFELTIDTGMAREYASGGGLVAGYLSTAMPKVKLKLQIAAKQTDDIFAWKQNDTLLQMTANATSGTSQLNITVPNFTLDESTALTNVNGKSMWDINLSETDILQIGNTPLITVQVVNGVPSYLGAA